MSIRTPSVEIIGVSVFGPEPLEWAHLEVQPGLAALYGKNGVGKTRLLRSIADGLRGVRSADALALVHLHLPDPGDFWGGWRNQLEITLHENLSRARGQAIADLAAKRDEHYQVDGWEEALETLEEFTTSLAQEDFSPTSVEELVAAHVMLLDRGQHGSTDAQHWAALARELSGGGLFSLMPVGTTERPEWRVLVAGNGTMPTLESLRTETYRRHRVLRQILNEASDDDTGPQIDAATLREATRTPQSVLYPWESALPFGDAVVAQYLPLGSDPPLTRPLVDHRWPSWAPIPVLAVGTIAEIPLRTLSDAHLAVQSANRTTREQLLQVSNGRPVSIASDDEVVFAPQCADLLDVVSDRANTVLQQVLPTAPTIRFRLGTPDTWFSGDLPRWQFIDGRGSERELQDGSRAEVLWALFAIAVATGDSDAPGYPMVVLVDEPETGLHGSAEEQLPAALNRVAVSLRAMVLAATHSGAMLDTRSVLPVHVTKVGGRSVIRSMPPVVGDFERELAADELGVSRSRLLQLTRCWVVVEGAHDKAVLEGLLGAELRRSGAQIVKMGGAKNAPALVQATLLFDYTDAPIVIVLDGLSPVAVLEIWTNASKHFNAGNLGAARQALLRLEELPGWEAKWLRELLDLALSYGDITRIVPTSLSAPDVICYLPPHHFAEGHTWDELLAQWRAHYRPRLAIDLKKWLQDRPNGRSTGLKVINRALRDAAPHGDLLELARIIDQASRNAVTP